jgi:hypothetical protein
MEGQGNSNGLYLLSTYSELWYFQSHLFFLPLYEGFLTPNDEEMKAFTDETTE